MTWLRPGWMTKSIAARLVTLALLPTLLTLAGVNASLFYMSMRDAEADVRERGRLAVASLVESSRYGVVSGNLASVERAAKGLMSADRSVMRVEVMASDRRSLVAEARSGVVEGDDFIIEAPITASSLDIDLQDFRAPGTAPARKAASSDAVPPVGFVRVTLSPRPLLEGKRQRLVQGSLLVLAACAFAAMAGLYLARRMRRPLDAVMTALRQVRHGRFDVAMEPADAGELRELQDAILDMAHGLGAAHRDLEGQVARRTQELEAAMEGLRTADAEKRRLIARGNELVEHERTRLSREIHDELNAALIAIRLQAGALAADAIAGGDAETHAAAQRISSLTDDVYQRARGIVTGLRPEVLDTLGLAGAVEEVVRHFDEMRAGCHFEFTHPPSLPSMPESIAIAAYRVAQEALSNVVKHAKASRCEVSLDTTYRDGRPWLRLVVADNGRGFDPRAASPHGLGLIGMRERVMALRGSIDVSSRADAGTTLTVLVPLGAGAEA